MMRKPSTPEGALSCVPLLLLLLTFCFALATPQVSGNEVNADEKLVNQDLAKIRPEVHDEEAKFKFKGFFHPKPFFKKPIPVFKHKTFPIPVHKPIPVYKPVSIYKPIPKPVIVKNPFPSHLKPVPKPFTFHKKPFFPPVVEPESFFKPKPFFKKPFPFHPKFKKPFPPSFPVHKSIPTP